MTALKRGQLTGKSDLYISLRNKSGSPVQPAEIYYNLYDFTTGQEILLPPSNRAPVNTSVGEYFASFAIPVDANLGEYRIRWFTRQQISGRQVEIVQKFSIVQDPVQLVNLPGASSVENDVVRSLRVLLRDNSPARNYHFQPPSGEESVNQFNRVFGYIWEDAELLEFLKVAADTINLAPPATNYYTIDQMMMARRAWRSLLLNGGVIYATQALAINWVSEEFGYSISGVSLDIEKSSKYQSLMNDAQARFDNSLEQAKQTVIHFLGLKQPKYGMGVRSSFGPAIGGGGTITPRKFVGL